MDEYICSHAHPGAYSTNVSLSNGSFSDLLYHRRERPDILFDADGNPSAFYSALQETAPALETTHAELHLQGTVKRGFGWSFSFAQEINTVTES